ncbi:MAG: 6-bladed beta-propeller [Gemmatimonadales bacterium]
MPSITLASDLRIGSLDDRDYALTWVGDLEVSSTGTIYVNQLMQQLIRVFSSTGRSLRRIGRMGGGPGEFQAPLWMGWKRDSLWVYDGLAGRFSIFDAGGGFVRAERLSIRGRAMLLVDGSIAVTPSPPRAGAASQPLLRFRQSSETPDTLLQLSGTPPHWVIERAGIGVLSTQSLQPFADDPLWTVAPGGNSLIVVDRTAGPVASNAQYIVTALRVNGDTIWTAEFTYRPRPLTDEIVTAIVRKDIQIRDSRRGSSGYHITEPEARKGLYRPKTLAPVTSLVVGYDETIWLRREESPLDTVVLWDVIGPDGARMGRLETPTALRILRAGRGFVWAVELDDLDVPYVVRYQVKWQQ